MRLLIVLAMSLFLRGAPIDVAKEIIHSNDQTLPPAWVPLSRSVDERNQIRWDVLGPDARSDFEAVLANTPLEVTSPSELPRAQKRYDLRSSGKLPDCVYYGPSYHHYLSEPRDSVEDLAQSAEWTARGHVLAITPGFSGGEPFSLLTVAVDRTVSKKDSSPENLVYVLYPYAQFSAGEVRFCKDDYRFPHIPEIGDSVLVFAPRGKIGAEQTLLLPDRNYVVFESSAGIVLPRELKVDGAGPRSLDELEQELRRAKGGGVRR